MDQSTRFLIKRMDELEQRLLQEIKEVQKETARLNSLKHKVIGMVIGASFIVSSIVGIVFNKFGG